MKFPVLWCGLSSLAYGYYVPANHTQLACVAGLQRGREGRTGGKTRSSREEEGEGTLARTQWLVFTLRHGRHVGGRKPKISVHQQLYMAALLSVSLEIG